MGEVVVGRHNVVATFCRVEIWVVTGKFDSRGKSISVDLDGPFTLCTFALETHSPTSDVIHTHTP